MENIFVNGSCLPPKKDARPYTYGEGGLGATVGTGGGQQHDLCQGTALT